MTVPSMARLFREGELYFRPSGRVDRYRDGVFHEIPGVNWREMMAAVIEAGAFDQRPTRSPDTEGNP